MISNQKVGALLTAIAVLGVAVFSAVSTPQVAEAARQTCDQPDTLIAACVNANVAKNNICVGVLSETQRCQVD